MSVYEAYDEDETVSYLEAEREAKAHSLLAEFRDEYTDKGKDVNIHGLFDWLGY